MTRTNLSPKWGEALDRHMRARKLSDQALATFLAEFGFNVHRATVGRWRKGMVPKQGIGIVPILADYFNCPVGEFLETHEEVEA